jgi:diguanylate cyclase (GGDEF)-like protein
MEELPDGLNETTRYQAVLKIIHQVFLTGVLPENVPDTVRQDPDFQNLVDSLLTLQQFTLALSSGNLDPALKLKGKSAGALKSLQSNLRHLTWQTQRIASGDLTHKVAFMGEFSTAFNTMVERLAESREMLEQRALELTQQRRAALNLIYEAQAAREEVEKVNRELSARLEEIQLLHVQLQEQAIRDPLTNCYNRRFLIENLEREFSRALREDYPISIIMLDIDHFKNVNDTFGHSAGDEVLRAAGQIMLLYNRQSDIVARYGGEEFILMLPNMPLQTAISRAEELREMILSSQHKVGENTIQVTASMGVAGFPEHGRVYEEVIQAADKALYVAKNSGRNRTICLEC